MKWPRFLCIGLAISLLIGVHAVCADPATASPSRGVATIDRFAAIMADAAQRFGIPTAWIRAVMRMESGGDVRAVSPKGAIGLMQLMPQTWAALRIRYGLGADPFDPHDNIAAGAAYLRELHDRYGAPGFLAAYNAGPARYDDYLATGRAMPAETRAYVAALASIIIGGVADEQRVGEAALPSWTEAPLFAGRAAKASTTPSATADPPLAGQKAAGPAGLAPQSAGLFVMASKRSARP